MSLEELITVEGASGHNIPYLGYVEVDIGAPGHNVNVQAPVLVVPSTEYSKRVPVILGTNVLSALEEKGARCHHQLGKLPLVV